MQVPELSCMDSENYKKFFRALLWSGTRKEKKFRKLSAEEKLQIITSGHPTAVCHAPALLGNSSQFTVYANVRKSILSRWRQYDSIMSELSDDSDEDDSSSTQAPLTKLPKVTGIGLRTVFTLISQARYTDARFCEHALKALLDVLQGHAPEQLAKEPAEVISNLHSMLVEVASGSGPSDKMELPSTLTAISSSCLIALSVARGEAELILNAVASLIMSPPELSDQYIQVPSNLITLQRSVLSVILGSPSRNQWLYYGVPQQSLVTSFPVDLPIQLTRGPGELVVRSLVSDGCFLYVFTSKGLLKIGSGYGSSIGQHVYLYKPDFFASERHGWLGCCKDKLYLRIGRKKTDVYEIDKDTLEVRSMIRLDPGEHASIDQKSAVFTDGNQLGLMLLPHYHKLLIKMYDVDTPNVKAEGSAATPLASVKEYNVHLLRRRTLMLGKSPFEDGLARRNLEIDAPIAMQMDDCDDDPILSIHGGQEFALLITNSGKVYYSGKGQSLGYKASSPQPGRWALMKETIFPRNDIPSLKRPRVMQVAIGHEGIHAVLVVDNGTAMFTGIARRGEDGDIIKHRRTPKPTRPKKIFKAEGHDICFAACNYGSSALVTRSGFLLMFGKDTQYCDSTGVVYGLRHEKITMVALGKAHAVALTNFGQVYTFGINNKGQCGREFGYTKEKFYNSRRPSMPTRRHENKEDSRICTSAHTWTTNYCRICILCRECTGFSSACHCANLPNRVPGEKCGCGEGDSGCSVCGVCRQCAETFANASKQDRNTSDIDEDADTSSRDPKGAKVNVRLPPYEGYSGGVDGERDASMKVNCLPPGKISVPSGHRVVMVSCGMHHTVLLTELGDVFTFGSNQFGQLGAGDILAHHRIIRVRVPRAFSVGAGSNHTVVVTRDGELYTFGCYQKGALGRPRIEDPARNERAPIWYATPGRVPRLGPKHSCKVVSVSVTGDQTFVNVSQSVVKTDTLFSSTITSNTNSIIILPNRPEHTFKCVTINKNEGTCNAWTGPEQVDFVNTLACLDPLYDVLWCYQPQMRVMKCYNIQAYDAHKTLKCCNTDADGYFRVEYEYPNYGNMVRLEDFKNMGNIDLSYNTEITPTENVALSSMLGLNQELPIPTVPGRSITRMHAALHLLGCLDSLNYSYDIKLNLIECKKDDPASAILPVKEEFLTVNRFEGHGGGWGYSGHSVEAIRFMCDTDILLGGFGLFGGRGEYTATLKLYDIGVDGGEQEGDGELLEECEDIVYECAPRDQFPVLFEMPVEVMANRWYVVWVCINGPSSDCGSSGQAMVINDEIGFHFKTSKKSNNGTDVNAGQIPCVIYNTIGPDQTIPQRPIDPGEPIIQLSRDLSRKVTIPCFRSIISILQWSWDSFKRILFETNGQIPINFKKLTVMKHQKRLVYVIRACLRLVKSFINEIYPQNNKKRNSQEYMSYFEAIAEVRNLIQTMLADPIPTCGMLPRIPGKNKMGRVCYVKFALELTNSILKEAYETITACFHAFFPTPTLKWHHLCSMLVHVQDGKVPQSHIRELTAICAAMCSSRSLRDVLQYVVPVTQSILMTNEIRGPDSKVIKEVPSTSATVPRSSKAQKPPPIPPRANSKEVPKQCDTSETKLIHTDWHLLDVIPRMLDIVMIPIQQQIMPLYYAHPHDHGMGEQGENLVNNCCKLIARIVAELSYSANNIRDDSDNAVQHMVTPSRFMRINQSRVWNTGNGSPDAICFTVDTPGVTLAGVSVYGGLGNYDYTLELMQDVQLRSNPDDANPDHCWVSVDVTHGSFSASDCMHDMVQLKFENPVLLTEDLRYAIRFCNHGGRTSNGDCGLPSVKGPDGTTFRFASCSLSYNGTTLARGQIPCFIYNRTANASANSSKNADNLVTGLRSITLQVASIVIDRSSEMFCMLRNELTTEDLKRSATLLQQSPTVNTLIPHTLANLEGLDDSKSVIKILDMVHKLLPHVAALNLLVPNVEGFTTTTGHYYTWVESEHPYKKASIMNTRVLFPSNVSWIVLEMDPRSITAQPEDSLTIYAAAGTPRVRCHCSAVLRVTDPPFRKKTIHLTVDGDVEELADEVETDVPCIRFNATYVGVTPRLTNKSSEWPQKAIVVPGNEVIFSLETVSDYVTEYNTLNNEENRFGYRCLCVGYEDTPLTTQRQGLGVLEMELIYAGAACGSRLLAPDLDIPLLNFATMMEVQVHSVVGCSSMGVENETPHDSSEALFLSRGLELSSPPTVHQVIDGLPLLGCVSTERQFLSDFVAGAESTAGGRLARWLAPISRVEPSKCELKAPTQPVPPNSKLSLPILIRDQYGEPVSCAALKVEVMVQRINVDISSSSQQDADQPPNDPDAPAHPTVSDTVTMTKPYQNYSFEEMRLASKSWGDGGAIGGTFAPSGRNTAVRLSVRTQSDGSYLASWIPSAPGTYALRCTLDELPTEQEVTVEVAENIHDGSSNRAAETGAQQPSTPPTKLLSFLSQYSSGLRIRASPCLLSEEVGRVPAGANIAFVEEVTNKTGTWIRLSPESLRAFAEGAEGAWCLQHHRLIDRVLLVPVEPATPPPQLESTETSGAYGGGAQGYTPATTQHYATNEMTRIDERRYAQVDREEGEPTPLVRAHAAMEPSKRGRDYRTESLSSTSSRPNLRRSNGNNDGWWSPDKLRSNENLSDVNLIQETDFEQECNQAMKRSIRLSQIGTQTSPEGQRGDMSTTLVWVKSGISARGRGRDWLVPRLRQPHSTSPPPLPARTAPAPPAPRKQALSPAQGECLRAIFAALLWHEGIVHDAIACAAFLKFHPHLPKQGTRVVTRAPHDVTLARQQRHSVEVTNAGQYLQINPSTLETLTRSGVEATTSRMRKTDIELPIREEEPHSSDTGPLSVSVVNVLPPALRVLVALWDALYESEQLSAATDKNKKYPENIEIDDTKGKSGIRAKRDNGKPGRTPYTVPCELCGGSSVPPPLAAHMRVAHPGCGVPTNQGFDRKGNFQCQEEVPKEVPISACGKLVHGCIIYYMFCEKCYDLGLKTASSIKQTRAKVISGMQDRESAFLDHQTMKENALFLLDLAPLTNSESLRLSGSNESSRSPPTPPGSVWQPAPPFQCLAALGAAPRTATTRDTARYHSLGRHPPPSVAPIVYAGTSGTVVGSHLPRVHRSVSMSAAGGSDLVTAAKPPLTHKAPVDYDTLSAAGSSLLAQPSASLRRLIGGGDWTIGSGTVSAFEPTRLDSEALMKSPVLSFILVKRDLHLHRQKMDAAVRINTVRQYAFEALNWLLRSATQPTCVHDVMWWFCNALDKFARIVPPPIIIEDNRENASNEPSRGVIPTASATTICPGGRSARGARSAFHAFLGSVSALAPSLPTASAVALQAVRCWALHYSPHDRAFLHRSQVFNVISKILSHSVDEDGVFGLLHDSFHSYIHKENYIWNCPDVTGWCDITVSSRQAMAGALTDGSTETFWESGEEDRNKARWIQISYPRGTPDTRPHILCIHVDNTRDTVNKTFLMSFMYSTGTGEMYHMQDADVDLKTAAWYHYTLPRISSGSVRVRCEMRGPEPSLRIRQIRVLGMPTPARATHVHLLQALAETDTLRVFRLLTSQVFGKLLEWDRTESDLDGEAAAVAEDITVADDSDLREHVVGILFAGHKLTSLQKQVMSHIVSAIGSETSRVRADWENTMIRDTMEMADLYHRRHPFAHDNYCFEMLSLLLALSGSSVGRLHLAQQTALLSDLLALLHTGSERVQRQVILLLRRMISEIPPQKMLTAISYDAVMERVTLLDHLVCYIGKAITVQTKVKGDGAMTLNLMLGDSHFASTPWFMRGETTKKHAHLIAKLLSDMCDDKVSLPWGLETRKALTGYLLQLVQIPEGNRRPDRCIALPPMWMALAALCVCEQSHIELINGSSDGREARRDDVETRRICINHDDGSTLAEIDCRNCGPLCSECDRFLHLNRSARTHQRQICKEEESAIRIDIRDGCGRAKLFWLLLFVDRQTLKALAEFRGMNSRVSEGNLGVAGPGQSGPDLAGTCRFCGNRGSSGLLAIGNVCADLQCQEHGKQACSRVLSCGHLCGGVSGEPTCLPCLHACDNSKSGATPLRQDADDMCMICFTDPLQAAPALQLKCGHVFHLHCCKKVLMNKWNGPRITFSFSLCPICKENMDHWTLEELLGPIRQLREEVSRKAMMRLEHEGLATPGCAQSLGPDTTVYAMERYAYYVCHKCGKAYFGGLARCEAESSGKWEPAELVCGGCSDVAGARICPKHAADFLEYKCRFCCSVAVFFCFGTSHFCNSCHDDFQRITSMAKNLLPQCPAGPKGEQLPGSADECPLHVKHPPTGEEYALGCGLCRKNNAF